MKYPFGRGWARWQPYLLLFPGIFFYLLIAFGPSLATSVYSFTNENGIATDEFQWVGLDNYKEFLFVGQAAVDNRGSLTRTLIFCVTVTVVQFALGLLVAFILNLNLWGTRFFRTIFFMPVILGVVIQGLIWRLFLYPLGGPLAQFLTMFGLRSEFLGGPPSEAFNWVIVVQIWANMGITMMIFLAGLQTIPPELYEAARIDGGGGWTLFRGITWPLLTPSVNINLILNIIGSLQAWQLFLVLVGYRNGTQVLGYVVYAQAFGTSGGMTSSAMRQGYAAAASIVLFFIVLVIGLTSQYLLRRREERILG
ncbi:MAG: sugar ABC transporter permease [Anaerolineae bacterium]|nr:sugar ABC transporter permease [Anaerolineae bacterium]